MLLGILHQAGQWLLHRSCPPGKELTWTKTKAFSEGFGLISFPAWFHFR